ncbi:MAG TPA: zf-HC2 domain-containing protein, partial [Acidimicrobiales bacterium]|nr:zf-HC2 domain-containing protein [Acidimicrobiales bacterium]
MRCSRVREAISARLDGEAPGIPADEIDAHLAACEDCRAWAAAAGELSSPEPAVVRGAMTPLSTASSEGRGLGTLLSLISTAEWRVLLAVIGLTQAVLAWPGVLDGNDASIHLTHELAAWDLGLAVGFCFVAWRPARAWGMLPLVALIVASMTVTSAVDVGSGN